ncbi:MULTISPECIES: NADH-quinone oxidoreductase subunit NuoG [Rubrivivax]|uniref:NADH-quinone oxidoreductase n=1 Tax=Rubrivivax benzoatilyticus TaxID=316997 RepID=A0ABX0HSN9_9BURK|nr:MULTISPECIES: NADH-quinone oxidoreductase subunit NuoG [Rubrivivax]EGJ11188.1 putative NADH dehydrogenase I chain G [Rubrivivax benzoatilyticus JA2 = ATCC BAA-35]MCC9596056.1 NADH-quinone oxidoreductase subunit NuoG [Rubrivivax sp. JA1055]MCC9647603.1 NADH-quinone oxidoreductase subunit NuoG [Rubrivivax sp. JA1029]NHK97653.1 NADH-quinone oxidoreductase subunit G [Rubrivivax benzoatilyticus]NHL22652.1 NADH-quinone oxidoreductase subunit G [Rubrivivax benzoatilyticus]
MIELELDGKKVQVAEGSMVMHAADAAGTYVPHFCYHKKLSIAANCRMCLVEIEKAPKPMPACATPVTQGMVVRTNSEKAVRAQKGVMEFLLINHPLDCPICDQGGECQLQDLSMGYGGFASRYSEEKRVVFHKDVGPLLSMEEMSRCIHCTRCVRFGQEIAGVMELGMVHRGEHSEITTMLGNTVDSELSGNMIDLCPVGAITSKPFRYQARTWELSRRKSVSPHDSTGANLIVQVKANKVLRVVPFENEDVNECWIADRDRFSYDALNSPSRLTRPMIKQGGQWQAVDWNTALGYVADGLKRVIAEFGPQGVGALGSAHSTVEELHLLAKLVRGLGSQSVDFRTRHADFANVAPAGHARWLGLPIAALTTLDTVFVVGSFLRKDHPLFAQRIRQAARHGARVHSLSASREDWAMPLAGHLAALPSGWHGALAEVAAAVAAAKGVASPVEAQPGEAAQAVAAALVAGEHKAVLLGNAAAQHPQASALLALAQWIGQHTGAAVGYLGEAANTVGAQLVGALPGEGGFNAGQMLSQPMKALIALNLEPVLDAADAAAARAALGGSGLVVSLSPFEDAMADVADVMLPIAPFTETAGSFVNAEGRLQSFQGVVRPLGDTRPAWKVLRVLGNLLGLPGFDHDSAEAVRAEALGDPATIAARLDNTPAAATGSPVARDGALERVADVPIYATDSLVRRSAPLQRSADARVPPVGLPSSLWRQLALAKGDKVLVAQGQGAAVLAAREEPWLADGAVRVAAGHPDTVALGAMFGPITVEKA